MSESDPYADLPEDAEEAFIILENHFSDEYARAERSAGHNDNITPFQMTYIAQVVAAIAELNLSAAFAGRAIPSIDQIDYSTYQDFKKDVEHYKTMLRIRHARRYKAYSVKFDVSTKQRIRRLLEQIKELVDKGELDDRKREALYARIRDLESELNRDRTNIAAIGALFVEVCGFVGQGFEKLEPLRKMVDSIGKAFGQAKSFEAAESPKPLPAPPKQIEPPRTDESRSLKAVPAHTAKDDDDDIPF
jgi:hypothetical protein